MQGAKDIHAQNNGEILNESPNQDYYRAPTSGILVFSIIYNR
jgi:hypothetical protein